MAEEYDYQRLMTACGGAFLGAILGAIVATLIILSLDFFKTGAGDHIKLAVTLICILAGAAWVAYYEVKRHAPKHV